MTDPTADDPLVIVELRASNIMRLHAVEVRPDPDENVVIIGGRNGAGKAQPLSEPVLTPTGWRPMGDLAPGDRVIGGDGKPVAVLSVHPQVEREVWKVTFSDGSWTRCSPDHLWSVSKWKSRRPRVDERRPGETRRTAKPISTKVARVASLAELVDIGLEANAGGPGRWQIPLVAGPVWFEQTTADLPIDPYVLGVILGDGHISSRGEVKFATDEDLLRRLGLTPRRPPSLRSDAIATAASSRWRQPLTDLGLAGRHSWDKFVPEAYLWSDIDSRAALLAGLLDTDGHPQARGAVEFASTSESLIDAVVHLTLSLGGRAHKSGPRVTRYTHGGEKRDGRPSWRVRVHTGFNPFTLARKAERWSNPPQRETARWIVSAERVEDEDCQCIRIDAADGLYVTRNFVVTHNTSILNSIALALGGGPAAKGVPEPIRQGEDHAEVTIDLGRFTVHRRYDVAAKRPTLVVTAADGARYPSPQKFLDDFLGDLTFDPLAFTRLSPREQLATLLPLVDLGDIDLDDLNRSVAAHADERLAVGRERDRLRGYFESLPEPEAGTPLEEEPTEPLLAELRARADAAQSHAEVRAHAESAFRDAQRWEAQIATAVAEVERLEALIAHQRVVIAEAEAGRDTAMRIAEQAEAEAEAMDVPDVDEITARIAAIDARNAQVRARIARVDAEAAWRGKVDEYDGLSFLIAEIDGRKRQAIADAVMPIDGLTFDDQQVFWHGVPLVQCSAAEQLRISMAIGLAANPKIRIMCISDGSLLDDTSLALVRDFAAEHGAQVWLERVGDGDPDAIIIEDGRLAGAVE